MEQKQTKTTNANDMLQKLDSHYEQEDILKKEIEERMQKLQLIRDEIQMMQTIILFQMRKEYKKKE